MEKENADKDSFACYDDNNNCENKDDENEGIGRTGKRKWKK